MAGTGPSIDETSYASNWEAFEGHGPGPGLSRRDTVSSTGSDGYAPMPPGKWLLNFHGNCPRCHHHHSAMEVKVKVASDVSKPSRVACENCKGHWLILGAANSTQISLISTATIQPDPVEREVQLTLINMIKSATTFSAIASPALARIPESSGEPSTTVGFVPTPGSPASATPGRITSQAAASSDQNEVPTPPLGTPSPGSTEKVRTSRSRHLISTFRLKLKVTTRFPVMQKLRLRQLFSVSKLEKAQPSANSLGKMPVKNPLTANSQTHEQPVAGPITARATGSTTHEEQLGHHAAEPNDRGPQAPGPSNQSPEAARFIETLKNEPLDLWERKEQITWGRQKYTQFKTHRANSSLSNGTSMVDNRTQVSSGELLSIPHTQPERLLGFIGLGSHGGLMDRLRLDRFARNHATPSAEEASSVTAVDDSSTAPNQRLSGLRSEQEHRRRGSPSPLPAARQHSRHPRGEARLSVDSTASANRGRMNRRSRGSTGVTSQLGHNAMSPSQISLAYRMEGEGNTNNEPENSPSPPRARLRSGDRRASP